MKLMDEKGRLFGRINVIDLLVILLVVAVVAVLGVKLVGNDPAGVVPATKLVYTVRVPAVEAEVYDAILPHLPDQLMAGGDMVEGYVTGVTSAPAQNGATLNTSGGAVDFTLREGLLDLTFTIEATVTNTVTNLVGTQEVRIGKSHIVKTVHFELPSGVVLTCDRG